MNTKNNKGITLVALIITIIVMLIIAGITIYGGSQVIKQAKTDDVKTNMLLLQAEVKNFVEQAKFENKKIENFLNEGVTVGDKTLRIAQAEFKQGVQLYSIETPMADLGLGKMDNEKYFIAMDIDKILVDVYFKPGVADSKSRYYFLSEMEQEE